MLNKNTGIYSQKFTVRCLAPSRRYVDLVLCTVIGLLLCGEVP